METNHLHMLPGLICRNKMEAKGERGVKWPVNLRTANWPTQSHWTTPSGREYIDSRKNKDGVHGPFSVGLARVCGRVWLSLDGHTGSMQRSWTLVHLSESCREAVSGSAESDGFLTGTPSCVRQPAGPAVCWWPLRVDVPPKLKWTEDIVFIYVVRFVLLKHCSSLLLGKNLDMR